MVLGRIGRICNDKRVNKGGTLRGLIEVLHRLIQKPGVLISHHDSDGSENLLPPIHLCVPSAVLGVLLEAGANILPQKIKRNGLANSREDSHILPWSP